MVVDAVKMAGSVLDGSKKWKVVADAVGGGGGGVVGGRRTGCVVKSEEEKV